MASLLRLALARKPGLGPNGTVPLIERSASLNLFEGLAHYAEICGLPEADADTPLPLLWPAVLAAPLHMEVFADRAFPLKVLGMVHLHNTVHWTRPLTGLPEKVDLRAFVDGHRPHHRGVEVDLTTELRVDGELIWSEVKTILCPGRPTCERPPKTDPDVFTADRSTFWALSGDLGRRYARIAGDRNPIHQYAWAAKLFGFKRHLIHGMWSLARAIGEMDDHVPDAGSIEMSFLRPIYLPGRVLFESGCVGADRRFAVRALPGSKVCLDGVVRAA